MNPNTAQSLDPKLKETYDRIMGTEVAKQPQSPAPEPHPIELSHVPVEGNPVSAVPQSPTPVEQRPEVDASTSAPTPATQPEMVSINTSVAPAPAAKPASSKKISPIIFVVVGVGFFLLYTVVWLKVFSIF